MWHFAECCSRASVYCARIHISYIGMAQVGLLLCLILNELKTSTKERRRLSRQPKFFRNLNQDHLRYLLAP